MTGVSYEDMKRSGVHYEGVGNRGANWTGIERCVQEREGVCRRRKV